MIQRLLQWVGPLHVVGGLALAASGFFAPVSEALMAVMLVSDDFVWSPFFVAILGPTIASWGLLFGYIAREYVSRPSPASWRAMLWSILVWAPVDTALCLKFGFYSGVVLNTVVFIALLLLLVLARRAIK